MDKKETDRDKKDKKARQMRQKRKEKEMKLPVGYEELRSFSRGIVEADEGQFLIDKDDDGEVSWEEVRKGFRKYLLSIDMNSRAPLIDKECEMAGYTKKKCPTLNDFMNWLDRMELAKKGKLNVGKST